MLSFNEVVGVLRRLGHGVSFRRGDVSGFPAEIAANFAYFEAHGYLGPDLPARAALANTVAGKEPTRFAAWAREHFRLWRTAGWSRQALRS